MLLTSTGRPWVRKELVKGRLVKCDSFDSTYKNLKKKLGFTKPAKQLRKTGATLLDSHPQHHRFSRMYLGHAPAGTKDRFYSAPDQASFDQAMLWLGQQLGQVPVEEKPADPARQAKGRKKQAT